MTELGDLSESQSFNARVWPQLEPSRVSVCTLNHKRLLSDILNMSLLFSRAAGAPPAQYCLRNTPAAISNYLYQMPHFLHRGIFKLPEVEVEVKSVVWCFVVQFDFTLSLHLICAIRLLSSINVWTCAITRLSTWLSNSTVMCLWACPISRHLCLENLIIVSDYEQFRMDPCPFRCRTTARTLLNIFVNALSFILAVIA